MKNAVTMLISLALLGATGERARGGNGEAAKYYATLKGTQDNLYAAANDFGMKIGWALKQDNKENIDQMKVAYVDALLKLRKARADSKSLLVPASKSAKDLSEAYQSLLASTETSMQTSALDLIRIVQDKNLAADQKVAEIKKIIKDNVQAEQAVTARFAEALAAFAKAYDLKTK
jgi:KaiC/GvpD/RAD55 family RecA-like ATPase